MRKFAGYFAKMKAWQVVIFLFGVFALLGLGWVLTPAEGVTVAGKNLRFASLEKMLQEASEAKVDVDSVLNAVEGRFGVKGDTLAYYRDFFYENPDRIYLPDNDYTYLDPVFKEFENARREARTVRVAHYGDSQIEMDRISSELREALQLRFGGRGTGMFPALSNVPSASISRTSEGNLAHYTMYGDSTTSRAGHNRYGVMAQVVQLYGGANINLRATKQKAAKDHCRSFSSVGLLVGKTSAKFSAKVVSDTLKPEPVVLDSAGVRYYRWTFPRNVQKATLRLAGNAEIYGVTTDGGGGVAVDNIPLRGCSGTIFTRISKELMANSYALDDTRLIILQFGGNYMPVTKSQKNIEQYQERIAEQIRFFKEAAPQARIIFIGPSDMGKSRGGRMLTWPLLPEMVDALKQTALSNGIAYWDLYRMMGGENSMAQWVKHSPAYAGPDYIHFTPAGANKVGEAFARSILTYYDFYDLRKTTPASEVKAAMKR